MKFESPSDDISSSYPHQRRSTTVEGVVNTLDWLLVALILALVFRAFAVEAFQIPTGSMAETLKGAHWHIRCLRCGLPYDLGGDSDTLGRPECPSCGYVQPVGAIGVVANGDRIFVNKCIYQFSNPNRWDVVVFKNPPNPQENYIKRLIGLPGETIEIIDGDVYVNGQIARKPRNVQRELWMCIYRNDFQPMEANARFEKDAQDGDDPENRIWTCPFENEPNSRWDLDCEGPTVFCLNEEDTAEHRLRFIARRSDAFRVTYAYNDKYYNMNKPICSDLMIRFWTEPLAQTGQAGALLEKYGRRFVGRLDFSGQMVLEEISPEGETKELRRMEFAPGFSGGGAWFEFANVDHRLVLRFDKQRLSYDLGPDEFADAEKIRTNPDVEILGSGKMRLRHVGLFRDTYYLSNDSLRARPGKPFTLKDDQFFVCGDNSPNSFDGRQWSAEGIGNNGKRYRVGIVPRDFLMGKAFFVYWSDAFRPRENMLPIIPNFQNLRVIYGGSEEMY